MDELITRIYDITLEMNRALEDDDYEKFDQLLNTRNSMMIKVDTLRAEHPGYQYTAKERQLLEDIRCFDQRLTSLLKENISETQHSLNQMKQQKQVTKKYRPFIKQTNGVFLDSKK
ncbi:flagellar protein FliT [Neobacillus vireti]|uniref:Flagellar protein FliT n=1 Tax=Neobacillus vireti LMG 21834 TaxID=1131730 RepID=A0AB94IQS7_9BACI|nr:flagellar protein FliT [Neobacillus vireti]ETI69352.1 hypothetical protein BAVI_08086 [Neobacillus vireti LMG 21834]KLT19823.1 hypothetical protein AA980_04480 [Neobacillus vireti]